jgi:hypothetical protein
VAEKYTQMPPAGLYVQSRHRQWRRPTGKPYHDADRFEEIDDEYEDEHKDGKDDELDSFDKHKYLQTLPDTHSTN